MVRGQLVSTNQRTVSRSLPIACSLLCVGTLSVKVTNQHETTKIAPVADFQEKKSEFSHASNPTCANMSGTTKTVINPVYFKCQLAKRLAAVNSNDG